MLATRMKTHWHRIKVQGNYLVGISNIQLIGALVGKMEVAGEKRMKVKVIIALVNHPYVILINFSFIINIILVTMVFLRCRGRP